MSRVSEWLPDLHPRGCISRFVASKGINKIFARARARREASAWFPSPGLVARVRDNRRDLNRAHVPLTATFRPANLAGDIS